MEEKRKGGEGRGGGGEGDMGGGGVVRENFSVIIAPSTWWGAWALRLPEDKPCDCVRVSRENRGTAVFGWGCQSNNCSATP